jgi:hypothetical protein
MYLVTTFSYLAGGLSMSDNDSIYKPHNNIDSDIEENIRQIDNKLMALDHKDPKNAEERAKLIEERNLLDRMVRRSR